MGVGMRVGVRVADQQRAVRLRHDEAAPRIPCTITVVMFASASKGQLLDSAENSERWRVQTWTDFLFSCSAFLTARECHIDSIVVGLISASISADSPTARPAESNTWNRGRQYWSFTSTAARMAPSARGARVPFLGGRCQMGMLRRTAVAASNETRSDGMIVITQRTEK